MLVLCTLRYKIPQNIINSLITLEINGICYNVKSFKFFNKLMYHNTLKHPQLIYNKLCKGITSSIEVKIVLWYKVTSTCMSSLTACPFSAVAAAAKSGFILLQNPHPWEEKDHSNQKFNTNVLHIVHTVYFYDFKMEQLPSTLLLISKPNVQKYKKCFAIENTDKHINWLIAFKKSMQHWS